MPRGRGPPATERSSSQDTSIRTLYRLSCASVPPWCKRAVIKRTSNAIFYNNIRPALLYLYTNHNKEFYYDIELEHKTNIYGIDTYPFINSLQKYRNNNCQIYSIEPDSTDNIIYVINNINKSLLDNTLIDNTLIEKKLIQQTNISSFHTTTHFLMNKFLCLNSWYNYYT